MLLVGFAALRARVALGWVIQVRPHCPLGFQATSVRAPYYFTSVKKLTLEATHVALLICAAAEEEEIFLHLMTPPGSCFSCMML